ncbi:PAS domain-containing protein [bacterium]|nr:PAS domain-containing protein [bacterium]
MTATEFVHFWIGSLIGGLAVGFLWLASRRLDILRKRRQNIDFRRALWTNLERLHAPDTPLPSLRRHKAEMEAIAAILDEWLPRLRADHADTIRQLRQMRIVLDSMTEGVLAIDDRMRLILANPAAAPLLGVEQEGLGRLLPELIRHSSILEYAHDAVERCRPHEVEIPLNLRDAIGRLGVRILEVRITPIRPRGESAAVIASGRAAGAVLVVQDVTELRRLERLRQDFVTNASHELKTPLASIKLYAESLLDWALEDPGHNRAFVERIEEQADRLTNLVSDMLALSKLESGSDVYRHVPTAIGPILRSRVASYRDRAEAKGIDLQLIADDPVSDSKVVAAEEALRQILDNLIDNAVKYTPEGGHVEVAVLPYNVGWLEVTVSDSGLGIPRADLERVFERFYRVDKARSRELGGTGLGLAIVKHMVAGIGGEVGVESQEGHGSRFRFTLPLAGESAPVAAGPEEGQLR